MRQDGVKGGNKRLEEHSASVGRRRITPPFWTGKLYKVALSGPMEPYSNAQQPSVSSDKKTSATTQKVRIAQGGHTTTGESWTPFLTAGAGSCARRLWTSMGSAKPLA